MDSGDIFLSSTLNVLSKICQGPATFALQLPCSWTDTEGMEPYSILDLWIVPIISRNMSCVVCLTCPLRPNSLNVADHIT